MDIYESGAGLGGRLGQELQPVRNMEVGKVGQNRPCSTHLHCAASARSMHGSLRSRDSGQTSGEAGVVFHMG